jgi:hypothetical protein
MEWLIGGGIVLALLIVLWFIGGFGVYRRVFADAHFQEIAARLPSVKQAALERLVVSQEDAMRPMEDPRVLLTSVGLAMIYTIGPDGGVYRHHLSVSFPARGYTAHAVGETFVLFVAWLLGIASDRLFLGISQTTVHHAEFVLTEQEQGAFAERAVEAPSTERIAAFRADWITVRKQLLWQRVQINWP